jgi:hypothetical protein
MMATLCEAYAGEAPARRAIAGLRAAGLPATNARLIVGWPQHDLRREPVGEFAGVAAPDARVGTFGDSTLARWRPAGGFAGNPDAQREGSFADADGHVVVSCDPAGHEHTRITGSHAIERLLRNAGVAPEAADRGLAQLRAGRALVLIQIAEMGPGDAAEFLEHAAEAA